MGIKFILIKIYCKLLHLDGKESCECINNYFRKCGADIGENCRIYSDISTSESYLIKIGNNVTISNDVQFLTHDNSVIKIIPNTTDLFGKVTIGNNCFIGARTIVLPGVSIGDNCIVGAGSVVTKSIYSNTVVAGNPAKVITTVEEYRKRISKKTFNIEQLSQKEKQKLIEQNKDKLICK